MFYRIDLGESGDLDESLMVTDTYKTEQEVIDDAMRYYQEHWDEYDGDLNSLPEDERSDYYDENFTIESFDAAVDFWQANDYMILKDMTKEKNNA